MRVLLQQYLVNVAQTTRQTDHKLICLELAVGCNQGCMNEAIKLQEGVTTSVLHATEELSPVVAVHERVTTAVSGNCGSNNMTDRSQVDLFRTSSRV
jgi:hypothetical protein